MAWIVIHVERRRASGVDCDPRRARKGRCNRRSSGYQWPAQSYDPFATKKKTPGTAVRPGARFCLERLSLPAYSAGIHIFQPGRIRFGLRMAW